MIDLHQKSKLIFNDSISWLLNSDIRIKNGPDRGAMYGWKDLDSQTYPFIYSEITGYAITSFLWIYSEINMPFALEAAKEAAYWIIDNMKSYLVPAGWVKLPNFTQKGDISTYLYSFDNGMIMAGLVNLYKVTLDDKILTVSQEMANAIIKRFYDGFKLGRLLDTSLRLIVTEESKNDEMKWSNMSGPYHAKLALGLLELSRITGNNVYSQVSDKLCEFALKFQTSEGRFCTKFRSQNHISSPALVCM